MAHTNTIYPLSTVQTLALYTQGLVSKAGTDSLPTSEKIYDMVARIGAVQIDTISVIERSQYVVLWSRLGQYDCTDFDKLVFGDESADGNNRRFFEYWLHEASIVPLTEYRYRLPHMRKFRESDDYWNRSWGKNPQNMALMKRTLQEIKRKGPLRSAHFEHNGRKRSGWWDWKPAKHALEQLYNQGDLMIAKRINFQRVYNLRERVLPSWVSTTEPSPEETTLHLLEVSLHALGVCRPAQIADYTHMRRTRAKPFVEKLVSQRVFVPIQGRLSDGKVHELLVHRDHLPVLQQITDNALQAERTTFLSPFDNLFWAKGRDAEFWNFCQRLEAYKPQKARIWGYFCLPILHREKLIGRFDPKLDRKTGSLCLQSLYLENKTPIDEEVVQAIAAAIRDFMQFNRASDIRIAQSRPREFRKKLLARL